MKIMTAWDTGSMEIDMGVVLFDPTLHLRSVRKILKHIYKYCTFRTDWEELRQFIKDYKPVRHEKFLKMMEEIEK